MHIPIYLTCVAWGSYLINSRPLLYIEKQRTLGAAIILSKMGTSTADAPMRSSARTTKFRCLSFQLDIEAELCCHQ
jgi:hypothetical protein